jgi:ribosomal protein S18 acetylase RimI-like enzyme
MITILLHDSDDRTTLEAFGECEWPAADREHYGTQQVDFSKPKLTFKAIDDDKIVGCIQATLDMGVCHIDSLLVAESHRGQHIATRLLAALEEKAKSMGSHKSWLETGADWAARAFYEKQGYILRAELTDYFAHRDFVLLDKDLR